MESEDSDLNESRYSNINILLNTELNCYENQCYVEKCDCIKN